MSADDPLTVYMREFAAQLKARGLRRRRILTEVRAHVSEAVADLERDRPNERAVREAIARFGSAPEIAAQFNSPPPSTRLAARRLAVLWAAWLAAMAMGSATVWAAAQGGSAPVAHVLATHRHAAHAPVARAPVTHGHAAHAHRPASSGLWR